MARAALLALALAAAAAPVVAAGRRASMRTAAAASAGKAAAPQPVRAADPAFYWRYPAMDAPLEDIKEVPGATIEQLEAACTALPQCVGFNSDGWLKQSLANVIDGQPCDLYVRMATPQPAESPLSIWPLPGSVSASGSASLLLASTALTFNASITNADLAGAFARFSALVFSRAVPAAPRAGSAAAGAPVLASVTVSVANPAAPLELGTDESYSLVIPSDGTPARITAASQLGVYHALQTLSQLIAFDPGSKAYTITQVPIAITDAPRFPWRGLLVDTSRHWQPLPALQAILDSMAYAKLNVMHWHIVDEQSWPVETPSSPLLWEAAWSPSERYTLEDVAAVVEYARQRGIRVVAELDTPGHAGSMCVGYPEVCPTPTCTMPLNPASNATLPLIQGVFSDLASVVPDAFMHGGGDEVDTTCWSSTPAVVDWMQAHNLTPDGTYEYFVAATNTMMLDLGKAPVRWEEVWQHFGTALDPRTVVHVWLSASTLANVTAAGYRALYSLDTGDAGGWYLDDLTEGWESFYAVDVLQGVQPSAASLVLGGEACMWGETADGSDVLQTIWPRAAAVAERLWSYNVTSPIGGPATLQRLQDFRCRLLARGIPAAPVENLLARTAPPGPGSCVSQ